MAGGGAAKKKTKSGKNTKGVANVIDGVSISEMSREQLEPFIVRIQLELEREREERHFFQLERDKIKTFWEIARQQLQEYRSNSRNKDKQLEKLEAGHEMELKVYQQKMKYLLHGQHAQLSELKVENMISLKGVEQDAAARESLLLDQDRTLKLQITDRHRRHKNQLRTLFLEKNAQISKMRFESEKRRRAFEHKYQRYLQQSRDEMRLKNTMACAKIEQGKNTLVKSIVDTHCNVCRRADQFFTDIIAQNLALICALKRNISTLNEENIQMKNEIRDMRRQNSQLVTPLKIANRKIAQYQNELNLGRRDAKICRVIEKQTKMLRKENENYKIRYLRLVNLYEQAMHEKKDTIEALTSTRLKTDEQMAYRELSVQRAAARLKGVTQSVQNVLLGFCSASSQPLPYRHGAGAGHHTTTSGTTTVAATIITDFQNENSLLMSLLDELHGLRAAVTADEE